MYSAARVVARQFSFGSSSEGDYVPDAVRTDVQCEVSTNWTCVQIASSPQKQAAPCDLAPPCGVSVQRVLRGRLDAGTS